MGAVVLVVVVVFVTVAYTRSDVATVQGYEVFTRFSAVDGLNIGDDVRISGMKIGSVIGGRLDSECFQAEIRMSIDPAIKLPEDTTAAVVTEGLLGGKYVSLDPGGAEELIAAGGEIKITQASVNLEGLLGKVIYGAGGGDGG